jgi:hypothetical protein
MTENAEPNPEPPPSAQPNREPPSAQPNPDPPPPTTNSVDRQSAAASALPKNPRDRRATIIVAVIAAGAALLGALTGGIASYQAAKYSANATKQEDVDKFHRDERRQAYTSYLQSIAKLEDGAAQISNDYDSYPNQLGLTTFGEDVKAFLDDKISSDNAQLLIDLIGSKGIRSISSELHEIAFEMSNIAARASDVWYDKSRNRSSDIKEIADKFNPLSQKFDDDLVPKLNEAARADLGTTD